MKISYEIAPKNVLRIKVSDRDSERSWTVRPSHKPEQISAMFADIACALGWDARSSATEYPIGTNWIADKLMRSKPVEWIGHDGTMNPPPETPERRALRQAAEAAQAGVKSVKAIQAADEGEVGSLPEVLGRTDDTQQTTVSGFETLTPPSAAVDGTVYDTKSYRKDKSNWVK